MNHSPSASVLPASSWTPPNPQSQPELAHPQLLDTHSQNDCFPVWISRQQPHYPTNNPNASKVAQKVGGADGCPRCGQAVYAAEKVVGAGKVRAWCWCIAETECWGII